MDEVKSVVYSKSPEPRKESAAYLSSFVSWKLKFFSKKLINSFKGLSNYVSYFSVCKYYIFKAKHWISDRILLSDGALDLKTPILYLKSEL